MTTILPWVRRCGAAAGALADGPADDAIQEYRRLAEAIASTDFRSDAYRRLERKTRRIDALIRPGDRSPTDVVLRHARALLGYLTGLPGAPDFTAEAAGLEALGVDAESRPARLVSSYFFRDWCSRHPGGIVGPATTSPLARRVCPAGRSRRRPGLGQQSPRPPGFGRPSRQPRLVARVGKSILHGAWPAAMASCSEQPQFSTPGRIGAGVSRLALMFDNGRHDVKLSGEDQQRQVTRRDCNSLFYGGYGNPLTRAQGEPARQKVGFLPAFTR